MKSNWTMYRIARALAIEKGPRIVTDASGNRACCYALYADELMEMYARNGFNIRGVTWRNNVSSWRIYGEVVPDEKIIRSGDDWFVCFTLDKEREMIAESRLIGFMAKNNIGKVIS